MLNVRIADYATPDASGTRRLDWTTIQRLLRQCPTLAPDRHVDNVAFTLDGLDYLNVDGLFWILLISGNLSKRADALTYLSIPSGEIRRVLSRTGFLEVGVESLGLLDLSLAMDSSDSADYPHENPVGRFHKIEDSSFATVANHLAHYFRTRSGFIQAMDLADEDAFTYAQHLHFSVFQLCQNIVKHAGSQAEPGSGYVIIDRMPTGRLRICLGDSGCGLMASLKSQGVRSTTPFEALRAALLHRYHGQQSLEGIFRVLSSVHRWGGFFRVMSDGAVWQGRFHPQPIDDNNLKTVIESAPPRAATRFPGVQYLIDFDLPR